MMMIDDIMVMIVDEDDDDCIWQERAIKCAWSIKGWEMPNSPPNGNGGDVRGGNNDDDSGSDMMNVYEW